MCFSRTLFVSTLTSTLALVAAAACVDEELSLETAAPIGARVAKAECSMTASPLESTASDPAVGGAVSISLDAFGGNDIALVFGDEREGASSIDLTSSRASDFRFDPMPKSIPFLARTSLNEVGLKGCRLVERSRGVELSAAPLLAEPAGEEGSEAILYCTGRSGIGGLAAVWACPWVLTHPVEIATVSCGVV